MKYFYYESINHMDGRRNGFGIMHAIDAETAIEDYYEDREEEGNLLDVLRLYEITEDKYKAFPYFFPEKSQIVYNDYEGEE